MTRPFCKAFAVVLLLAAVAVKTGKTEHNTFDEDNALHRRLLQAGAAGAGGGGGGLDVIGAIGDLIGTAKDVAESAYDHSCDVASLADKDYCTNKCLELNKQHPPMGPNRGGLCQGGKCHCTLWGSPLDRKCKVAVAGQGGLPGGCAKSPSYCPKNAGSKKQGSGVEGCRKGEYCCY